MMGVTCIYSHVVDPTFRTCTGTTNEISPFFGSGDDLSLKNPDSEHALFNGYVIAAGWSVAPLPEAADCRFAAD